MLEKFYRLHTEEQDDIIMWGDSSGAIYFRVNMGSKHSMDEDESMQIRMLQSCLTYYKSLKKGKF